ncbi:MAG: hypothetical protein EAZ24_06550 [Burkholderiales bacterium]|nr:MAG: hypothetical protein EAZ21_13210 [Betaproteobacteria bacterium]TAG78601.1 MAG: hypothetical protein EAZ24_06550 [Burkholderiales bacterium]
MPRFVSARRAKDEQTLSGRLIRRICRQIFPRRNEYNDSEADFEELVVDLAKFGIATRGQFRQLLTRNRRTLMQMDRAAFDPAE